MLKDEIEKNKTKKDGMMVIYMTSKQCCLTLLNFKIVPEN